MINWELRLVAKIIDTGDLKTAIKERVTADVFHNTEARSIFDYLHEIYQTRGTVPTMDLVQENYPRVPMPKVPKEELTVLCDHVRNAHLSAELRQAGVDVAELAEVSTKEAMARLSQAHTELSLVSRVGDDLSLSRDTEEWKREYALHKKLRRSGKSIGVEYPWDILNKESMGMLPEELILFYGRPKSMKTFITCYIAAHAYFKQRKRVLFFTKEMSTKQIRNRILCSIAEIDYGRYHKAELSQEEDDHVISKMEQLRDDERQDIVDGRRREAALYITSDRSKDGGGVSTLQAMIEQYDPDLVCVDGVYLMRDDRQGSGGRDWKSFANIMGDLKALAQRYQIPILCNSQANRFADDKKKGAGLRDVAFGDAAAQDTDVIIRVDKGLDTDGYDIINLVVAGSREFRLHGFTIGAVPCTDFDFKRLLLDGKSPQQERDEATESATAAAQKLRTEQGLEGRETRLRTVNMRAEGGIGRRTKRRSVRTRPDEEDKPKSRFRVRTEPTTKIRVRDGHS